MAPVIFLRSHGEDVAVSFFLTVAPISALRRVRVRPLLVVRVNDAKYAAGQVGNRCVVLIRDGGAVHRHLPGLDVSIDVDVSASCPGGVENVFVSFAWGSAVHFNLFGVRLSKTRGPSPSACRHCMGTILLDFLGGVVRIVPVPMGSFSICVLGVRAVCRKVLTVRVRNEGSVCDLCLRRVRAYLAAVFRVVDDLVSVRFLKRRPSYVPRPRGKDPIHVRRVTILFACFRLSVAPELVGQQFTLYYYQGRPSFRRRGGRWWC